MKKLITPLLTILILASGSVFGQVAINTDGSSPTGNAILHVKGSGNNNFYIDNTTGYVGIGTTSPTAIFHIYKSAAGSVGKFESATGEASIELIGTSRTWGIVSDNSPDVFRIRDFNVGGLAGDRFAIDANGNIGIGTNSPSEKLDVQGNVNVSGYVNDVKTAIIRDLNGGLIWSHPAGINVSFDPSTEEVVVENATGDASDYWDIVIKGDATGANSVYNSQYLEHWVQDGSSVTHDLGSNNTGWFEIVAADQNDEIDGFVLHVVYYSTDVNGLVQYWDE